MKLYSAELNEKMSRILQAGPVLPVITIDPEDSSQGENLLCALYAAGIRVYEITLRSPAALPAIKRWQAKYADICVGVGTVCTPQQAFEAHQAGAAFLVSPGTTPDLLDAMIDTGLPCLTGLATPSELLLGYQRGCRVFKFFPAAAAGGIPMLQSFSGPFADVKFCPTGGVSEADFLDYLRLPNVLAVGGTWLAPAPLLNSGDWQSITSIAQRSLKAAQLR